MTADTFVAPPAADQRGGARATAPLAAQVAEVLAYRIGQGIYPRGSRIPSGPVLAADLQVSDATIERARNILGERGVLRMEPLEGSYVRDELPADFTPPAEEPELDRRGLRRSTSNMIARDPEPLAAWVAAVIKSRIAAGTYPPGHKLPVRQQLVEELNVGRHSIDRGLKRLAKAGLITAAKLKGTVVAQQLPARLGPIHPPPRPPDPPATRHRKVQTGPRPDGPAAGFGDQTPKEFGERLREARRAAEMTHADLGALLDVPQTTLAELERGYLKWPNPETLQKVVDWLNGVFTPKNKAKRRYFVTYRYLDPKTGAELAGNTITPLPARPETVDEIRGLEKSIGAHYGYERVRLAALPEPVGD